MKQTATEIRKLLSGNYASIRLSLDVINRVSQVTLIDLDGSSIAVSNEMMDVGERSETGGLVFGSSSPNEEKQILTELEFASDGVNLQNIIAVSIDELGDVVSGIVLADSSGQTVEVFAAAEVCCLYVRMPGLSSVSEPEYEDSEYFVL